MNAITSIEFTAYGWNECADICADMYPHLTDVYINDQRPPADFRKRWPHIRFHYGEEPAQPAYIPNPGCNILCWLPLLIVSILWFKRK